MSRSVGHGRLVLAFVALIVLLAYAAPAGAATGFLADETLSPDQAGNPVVAMAPNGYAAAAWIETAVGPSIGVRVAVRPPGGVWSPPQLLGPNGRAKRGLDLAVDANGDAAVTWQESDSLPTYWTVVATRPAGGSFGAAEPLTPFSPSAVNPSVGIDGGGRVTLLSGANADVVVRDFQVGVTALAARQQTLAPGCSAVAGMLDVAPSGDAAAAWDCNGAVFALRHGGSWTIPPAIADVPCTAGSAYESSPTSVDVDAQGRAVGTVFTRLSACPGGPAVRDEVRLVVPAGGSMHLVPDAVASGTVTFGSGVYRPRAAVGPSGIVFTWGDTNATVFGQGMVRPFAFDGSPAGPPQTLGSGAPNGTPPEPAIAAGGRALATWIESGTSLVAAERPPGAAAFGSPEPVASGSGLADQQVALDDAGDGVIAWRQGSRPSLVHARGYDAAPPVLANVTIPSAGAPGEALAFSAAASDVWSALATSWSFGDGATAAGGSATHAYAAAGAYTATVTATDALGNASSQSGTVQVAAAGGTSAPRLTGASLTHRRFRVGRSRTAVSARRRAPVGTTFRFTLDRAASVRIAFAKQARGLRSGRRCVKPSRRLRRAGARRCTRLVAIRPALTRALPAGANAVPFSGRIGRRALAPGRYVATLTATADGSSGAPSGVRFRVVR